MTIRALLLALGLFATGCSCPDLVTAQTTPSETLLAWQSSLCHDKVEAEYACLSLDYKRQIGGLPSYHIARQLLLDEQPAFSYVLKRVDLLDRVVEERRDDSDTQAWITLEAGGEQVEIGFERETTVRLGYVDGRSDARQITTGIEELVVSDGKQFGTRLSSPRLPTDDLPGLRSLQLTSVWRIASVAGLVPPPPDAAGVE